MCWAVVWLLVTLLHAACNTSTTAGPTPPLELRRPAGQSVDTYRLNWDLLTACCNRADISLYKKWCHRNDFYLLIGLIQLAITSNSTSWHQILNFKYPINKNVIVHFLILYSSINWDFQWKYIWLQFNWSFLIFCFIYLKLSNLHKIQIVTLWSKKQMFFVNLSWDICSQ